MLPYKEFTDEEIIKAVECCSEPCYVCDECPLYCVGVNCSSFELHRYALDLINRQKSEIDRLKECENLLKAEKHSLIKTEAVKEFANRLKNKIKTECNPYGKPTFDYDTSLAIMHYIDNLVKEMVGDDNA